jgi:hypothetical protein
LDISQLAQPADFQKFVLLPELKDFDEPLLAQWIQDNVFDLPENMPDPARVIQRALHVDERAPQSYDPVPAYVLNRLRNQKVWEKGDDTDHD